LNFDIKLPTEDADVELLGSMMMMSNWRKPIQTNYDS